MPIYDEIRAECAQYLVSLTKHARLSQLEAFQQAGSQGVQQGAKESVARLRTFILTQYVAREAYTHDNSGRLAEDVREPVKAISEVLASRIGTGSAHLDERQKILGIMATHTGHDLASFKTALGPMLDAGSRIKRGSGLTEEATETLFHSAKRLNEAVSARICGMSTLHEDERVDSTKDFYKPHSIEKAIQELNRQVRESAHFGRFAERDSRPGTPEPADIRDYIQRWPAPGQAAAVDAYNSGNRRDALEEAKRAYPFKSPSASFSSVVPETVRASQQTEEPSAAGPSNKRARAVEQDEGGNESGDEDANSNKRLRMRESRSPREEGSSWGL